MSSSKILVRPIALEPIENGAGYSGFNSLGCIVAYAKEFNNGKLLSHFEFGRISPSSCQEELAAVDNGPTEPTIILLSCYVWNIVVNMEFAKKLKTINPHSLVIVGGPQIPKIPNSRDEFFDQFPYVDIAVRDEGEITFAELLASIQDSNLDLKDQAQFDFSHVDGISFRRYDDVVTTPDRVRTRDLSIFPSPYTTGEFDHWIDEYPAIMLESNRGCPYGCTFCDWGSATLSKLNRISINRIFSEIDFAVEKKIQQIHFCDANFGILKRDVEITKYVIDAKARYGFPKKMSFTNAKTASPHLKEILKLSFDAGLTDLAPVSMQTVDQGVLKNVERANIKLAEYKKILAFLHEEGIPTNSDMMIGLPGQTLETCKKDLQFFFDHKVLAVIFQTCVMPNAPMAEDDYKKKYKIVISEDGFVESTYSFSREEYMQMHDLCLAYKLFIKHGLMKHFLYFVQIEHGIDAIDFIDKWIQESVQNPENYPISYRIRSELLAPDYNEIGGSDWLMMRWSDQQASFLFDNFEAFQTEMLSFFEREFDLLLQGSAVESVLLVNRCLMRNKTRDQPETIELPHDVTGYFSQIGKGSSIADLKPDLVPLGLHTPGVLHITPLPGQDTYEFLDARPGSSTWPLSSTLRI